MKRSNDAKATANSLFGQAAYNDAIQGYDRATAALPDYLDYEVAVLAANIAACHVKLAEWKDAVDAATRSLDRLDRLDPPPKTETDTQDRPSKGQGSPASAALKSSSDVGDVVEEVDDDTAAAIEALVQSGHTRAEVQRIRIKALLRRATSREHIGGWMALQGADEDYARLAKMSDLAPLDAQAVARARRSLPARLDAARQQEMGEMMGKLKDLGNGFLKPFGLSTDNFQFTKDENSGGYSMNFNQNR